LRKEEVGIALPAVISNNMMKEISASPSKKLKI